jgi:hypothetical protein
MIRAVVFYKLTHWVDSAIISPVGETNEPSKKGISMTFGNLSLVVLALLPVSAFAGGDGSGFSGPTLNPVSIPVQSENGIKLDTVIHAMQTCYINGDPERGISSFADRMALRFGMKPQKDLTNPLENSGFYKTIGYTGHFTAYYEKDTLSGRVTPSDGWYADPSETTLSESKESEESHFFALELFADNFFGSAKSSIRIHYVNKNVDPKVDVKLTSEDENSGIPTITFTKIVIDKVFDQWGQEVSGPRDNLLLGVAIDTTNVAMNSVGLINADTKRSVPLTYSMKEVVECLQNEIQRGVGSSR